MIGFLEKYLQKKLQVAEYLYMYGKDFSREEAIEDIGLSVSTLSQYCNEIQEMYESIYKSGLLYSSQSLEKISIDLISQSKKMEVLRLLFLFPGHTATFYKKKLLISDASFSRIIAQLKVDLEEFDTSILVKEGYRIQAKNEDYLAVLFTFIALFYFWSFDDLLASLSSLGGREVIEELFAIDFSEYTFADDAFEIHFYQTVLLFSLLRQYQHQKMLQKTGNTSNLHEPNIQHTMDYLSNQLRKAQQHIQKYLPKAIEACFPNGISCEVRGKIEKLTVRVAFHLRLFPYEINTLPLRMMFFTMKFRMTHKEVLDTIDNFLYRASTYLRIDLRQRYEMVFFYIVTEDLLAFREKQVVSLYVYSAIGYKRRKFYLQQLKPLLGYCAEGSSIHILDDPINRQLPPNAWIITTDYLPNFPSWQQFVISDFLGLADQLHIMIWLKESTKKIVDSL